jgi:NAD synthase
MYQRSFYIGSTSCHLRLRQSPCFSDESTSWFGFPLFADTTPLTASLASHDPDMRGYFLRVVSTPQSLRLTTDLCGGFRLYYLQLGEEFWYSDDYMHLLSILRESGDIAIDDNEFEFWNRHRYTTGGRTYFQSLHKVPPGANITHNDGVRRVQSLQLPAANNPSAGSHTDKLECELRTTLQLIKSMNRSVVLSFSGGADSTLLAILCLEERIEFTPVFFRAVPAYAENDHDWIRAKAVAQQLGLNLTTIDTPLELDDELNKHITSRMLFDRHVCLLHFSGMREVARRFGTHCIILSGQGADSVLSFGPSQNTRGDFVARFLATYPFSPLSTLCARLVSRRLGRELHSPKNTCEFMRSFFDQSDYYSLLEPHDKLSAYLDRLIHDLCAEDSCQLSHLMRLKIHGFLQGSDNQVVIQSALSAGIDAVVLPFVTPAIINATIQHKNNVLDLFQPKYPVRRLLRKFGHKPLSVHPPAQSYQIEWSLIETQVTEHLTAARCNLIKQFHSAGVV